MNLICCELTGCVAIARGVADTHMRAGEAVKGAMNASIAEVRGNIRRKCIFRERAGMIGHGDITGERQGALIADAGGS